MRRNEVKVGETYDVRVSGAIAPVRITSEHPLGGWEGRNERTGRRIRIKSARRLRLPTWISTQHTSSIASILFEDRQG